MISLYIREHPFWQSSPLNVVSCLKHAEYGLYQTIRVRLALKNKLKMPCSKQDNNTQRYINLTGVPKCTSCQQT